MCAWTFDASTMSPNLPVLCVRAPLCFVFMFSLEKRASRSSETFASLKRYVVSLYADLNGFPRSLPCAAARMCTSFGGVFSLYRCQRVEAKANGPTTSSEKMSVHVPFVLLGLACFLRVHLSPPCSMISYCRDSSSASITTKTTAEDTAHDTINRPHGKHRLHSSTLSFLLFLFCFSGAIRLRVVAPRARPERTVLASRRLSEWLHRGMGAGPVVPRCPGCPRSAPLKVSGPGNVQFLGSER